MVLQILPDLQLPAKQVFILQYFWLKDVVGYAVIDALDGAGNTFGELNSGVNGTVLTDQPQVFKDAGAGFTIADVGRYLVTYDSGNIVNNGIWRIAAVPAGNTAILANKLHGPRFISDIGVKWRVVDPTLVVGAALYVLEAPASAPGTSPPWQVHFFIQALDTILYRFEVGPIGGWNNVGHVWGTASVTPPRTFTQDAPARWYLLADSTHIVGWTEAASGAAPFDCMYAGSAQTFRTAVDPSFAMAMSGQVNVSNTGMLNSINSLAPDNITPALFTCAKPADTFVPPPADNFVVNLQRSNFDLRNDVIGIPVASTPAAGSPEFRGVLRAFHYCSTLMPYKQFVSNNRSLVSLGNGICVDWNGTLVV